MLKISALPFFFWVKSGSEEAKTAIFFDKKASLFIAKQCKMQQKSVHAVHEPCTSRAHN